MPECGQKERMPQDDDEISDQPHPGEVKNDRLPEIDGQSEETKSYLEYQEAKNPRMSLDETKSYDPSDGFEGLGPSADDVDLGGDGNTTMKSVQEKMEELDWDPLGGRDLTEKGSGDSKSPLEWTREDIKEAQMSSEERQLSAIEDIRDLLRERPTTASQERAIQQALRKAEESDGSAAADLLGEAADTLTDLEEALDERGGVAQAAEDTVNQYVKDTGGDVEDSLDDLTGYLKSQAERLGPDGRRRIIDKLDDLEAAA